MTTTQASSVTAMVNDQPIMMLVIFKVKPEMVDTFKALLLKDLANARQESGCITMQLFAAKTDPNTLFFFERWQNQTALDNHFVQPYTEAVLELAKTLLISPMEILYLEDLAPLPVEDMQYPDNEDEGVDLVIIFQVKEEMEKRFEHQLLNSVRCSRLEPGCIAFHIHIVREGKSQFVLYERWWNQAAFDFHLAQPYTKELLDSFKATLAKPIEECLFDIHELVLPE
jgi:quinol monooxygenase YgiN